MVLMVKPVLATPPSVYEEFHWVQTYDGWGPALYYGETVTIEYYAVNRWHVEMKDNGDGTWTVNQELTQDGIAYIYDAEGNLIDKRRFRVTEITLGVVSNKQDWYYILDFDYVKEWQYHWIVTGVYHFKAEGQKFDIADYWNSVTYSYWVRGFGWTQMWP